MNKMYSVSPKNYIYCVYYFSYFSSDLLPSTVFYLTAKLELNGE